MVRYWFLISEPIRSLVPILITSSNPNLYVIENEHQNEATKIPVTLAAEIFTALDVEKFG
jgi:hypothetical protein